MAFAIFHADGSSPYRRNSAASWSASRVASSSDAGTPRLVSKRMSSGPPVRKPNPRSRSASWNEDRPRSNRAPSTAPNPAAGATSASSPEVRLTEDQPVAEGGQALRDPVDRGLVGVQPEDAAVGLGGLQDPLGVPTAADRRVDLETAGGRRERPKDLDRHHRQVP